MTTTDEANPYDEFPYLSVALAETSVERLAAVGLLFGLEPPPVDSARVLEMGCAGGGNLLPMAAALPGSTFVGVDLSPRQIDQAKAAAEAAGVTNAEFHARSITDLSKAEFGEFDYIVCHGVYSWVPDDVKGAILRASAEMLTPRGLAYISYNTFPGWHFPGMIREMMLYHVRSIPDQAAKVKAARAFLDFLGENVPEREGIYARLLRDEAAQLRPHADSYVAHEHLEELNHPIYFQEFAARAAEAGLRVAADSRVWAMASSAQPPMQAVLDRLAREPIAREQYYDFLTNRRFRRTILTRTDAPEASAPTLERVKRLRASAAVWPTTSPLNVAAKTAVDFRAADGIVRLSTTDPMFKAALLILTEFFPRSVTFEELWSQATHRLARSGVEPEKNPDILATRLLQAYCGNALEFHSVEPAIPQEVSERPLALGPARAAAETTNTVPNFRHRQATLSDFDRLVLRQLDGTRTHEEIVDRLVAAVQDGQFAISEQGAPLTDTERLRPILQRSLPPSLGRLLRAAVLVR